MGLVRLVLVKWDLVRLGPCKLSYVKTSSLE